MLSALVWGFLTSQALVGVTLTAAVLSKTQDPWSVISPLLSIAGALFLYAFVSGRRAASADRIAGPVAYNMARETTQALNERYDRLHRVKAFGRQYRFSTQLVATSLFLGLSVWILWSVLP